MISEHEGKIYISEALAAKLAIAINVFDSKIQELHSAKREYNAIREEIKEAYKLKSDMFMVKNDYSIEYCE